MIRVGNSRGFTIVELLIVIVVVAILAAIGIVSYQGIQAKAHKTAVLSDMDGFARKIKMFEVDNGRYPKTIDDLKELQITASKKSYLTGDDYGNYAYCVHQPDGLNPKIVIGGVTSLSESYYMTLENGFQLERYGGVITATSQLPVICAEIMGVTPVFNSLGYVRATGQWMDWVN